MAYFFGLPLSFTGSPLIFFAELVWWSHILSVSACLGSSLSPLFWMRALMVRVFLAACSSHLGPWIYPASPFWPARSLWRGLLLPYTPPHKSQGFLVSCCFKDLLFIFGICMLDLKSPSISVLLSKYILTLVINWFKCFELPHSGHICRGLLCPLVG